MEYLEPLLSVIHVNLIVDFSNDRSSCRGLATWLSTCWYLLAAEVAPSHLAQPLGSWLSCHTIWHIPVDTACSAEQVEDPDGEDDSMSLRAAFPLPEPITVGERLSETQRAGLLQVLQKFPMVLQSDLARTQVAEHQIRIENVNPFQQQLYHLPHAYRDVIHKELEDMETNGVTEPSTSEWASPIVPVPKKDGTIRLCVDFWHLNTATVMDAYPMPRVDDMLDQLGHANYISTLDLS